MKTPIPSFFIALVLALAYMIALVPKAQAVGPPSDGGYANFTTAEGTHALLNLTTGAANTGLGWSSLLSVTTGSFNTAVGAGTLALNTGDFNTAVGAGALLTNTIGVNNTANGAFALFSNINGNLNTAVGYQALFNNVGRLAATTPPMGLARFGKTTSALIMSLLAAPLCLATTVIRIRVLAMLRSLTIVPEITIPQLVTVR
jgi:hypothetical protein